MTDSKKVVDRFTKEAMAVVLRNVVDNWGFFSREDQRMHLQTVDLGSLEGPEKSKVWLEERGRRICEHAVGKIAGSDLKKLQSKVAAERATIENKWVNFMVENDWIKAQLNDSIITLTAYPTSHNRYERTIDLRRLFPGAYGGQGGWEENPPKVGFDRSNGLLAVGNQNKLDDRNHILVRGFLFTD